MLSALKMNLELDRAHVYADRLGGFVVQEYFDWQNSKRHGIRFAEPILRSRHIGIGIDRNAQAFMMVLRQGLRGGRSGLAGGRVRLSESASAREKASRG